MSKQYGLIKPKSGGAAAAAAKTNIFRAKNVFADDDSDSDDNGGSSKDWIKASMQAKAKRQTKVAIQKAIAEDATAFQYDEVYDDMKAKKEADKTAKAKSAAGGGAGSSAEKKPKYIKNLLKMAAVRNRENEGRLERKVQKEREAEGDEFADKEVFVTSAYRKKMEEREKEEEERRKEAMESILDVRKQKDMSGFYRHIYRQTMGEEKGQNEAEDKKEEAKEDSPKRPRESGGAKQRSYRRRKEEDEEEDESSSSESNSADSDPEPETEEPKVEAVETREDKERERRLKMKEEKERRERRKRKIEMGESSSDEEDGDKDAEAKSNKSAGEDRVKSDAPKADGAAEKSKDESSSAPKKPKVDVWKKVTVGQVFEDAVQRYFQRKSERKGFPWAG